MKIEFVLNAWRDAADRSALLACAMAFAKERGLVVLADGHWYSVEVVSFKQWLGCMYSAFAEFSRGCHPDAMRFRYPVLVHYDGRIYHTRIWFDEQSRGVRYGVAE